MNRILSLLLIVAGVTLLYTSCQDDQDPMGRSDIKIDSQDLKVVIKDDGTNVFSFSTYDNWKIAIADTASTPWATLSHMEGGRGENEIFIKALPNYDLSDRAIALTIEAHNTKIIVTILQPIANGLRDLPLADKNFKAYCLQQFDTNKDGLLSFDETKAVTKLTLDHLDIKSLRGIEYFVGIDSLLINNVEITTLNTKGNADLKYINVSNTKLDSLVLTRNEKLEELNCKNNPLMKRIFLKDNNLLKTIECDQNQLTSLDLGSCTRLVSLNCSKNKLTALKLGNIVSVEKIYCSDNKSLTTLDLTLNTNLAILDLNKNGFMKIDISKNANLTSLQMNGNTLSAIDVTANPRLVTLSVANNLLDTINVAKNTLLQTLDISNNNIRALDVSANDTIQTIITTGNPNLKQIIIPSKDMVINIQSDSITTITKKKVAETTPTPDPDVTVPDSTSTVPTTTRKLTYKYNIDNHKSKALRSAK